MADGTLARTLLLKVYGFAWALARPVLRRNKRLREGFSWRLVPEDWSGLPITKPAVESSSEQSPPRSEVLKKGKKTVSPETNKRNVPPPTIPAHIDVWIQAASGGEAYLAWELLKHLPEALARRKASDGTEAGISSANAAGDVSGDVQEKARPLRILVSTWTRQGLEVLHGMAATLGKEYPELSIRVTFFPLDAPRIMARALDQARPRVVALLETELWPGLMLGCAKRKIPVLVLNGRMTEKSLRGYRVLDVCARNFWKSAAPVHVSAISQADAARFAELFGSEHVDVVPNIKFDRALPALPAPVEQTSPPAESLLTFLPPALHHGRTVLLASTREEEEEALISTIRFLQARTPAPTIIVAPRHMHRIDAWRKKLDKAGLSAFFRSDWKKRQPSSSDGDASAMPAGSLVIWDTFGELNSLYMLADAVFVGGSLAPLGGQNFLEPLALGKIPCCGKHLENFDWALQPSSTSNGDASDSLESLGLLRRCRTAKALANILQETLEHPVAPDEVRQRFAAWLTPRTGGSPRCAAQIAEQLIRLSDTRYSLRN